MRLLGEAVHRLVMPLRKNASAFSLLPWRYGEGDQLLGLRHGERGEEVGENRLQRAAQPDVEEVRQVRVANVVVVGWVGGDDLVEVDNRLSAASRWTLHHRTAKPKSFDSTSAMNSNMLTSKLPRSSH